MCAIAEMIRILRPGGRALIYVWAKNQALKSKSSYLLQNRNNRRDDDECAGENAFAEKCAEKTIVDESRESGTTSLPIHTNRTQFEHSDILVPWKLKNPKTADKNVVCNQHPTTFLRFYHVFEENELEQLCRHFENVSIEKSYYDQGNWCVIFQKISANRKV